jgi:hypothetical protein
MRTTSRIRREKINQLYQYSISLLQLRSNTLRFDRGCHAFNFHAMRTLH